MRRRFALAFCCLLFAPATHQSVATATTEPPSGAVVRCAARGAPLGTVILMPGGAFVMATSPAYRRARCRPFTAARFDVIALAYPIFDYPAALHFATSEAMRARRAGRPVLAYGESAGGTLAEMLTLRGVVPAAVAVGGISDLTSWHEEDEPYWDAIGLPTVADRQTASPLHQHTPRRGRLLLLHSLDDETVPFEQSAQVAQRFSSTVTLGVLRGPHLTDPHATARATVWLRAVVARPRGPML